MDLRLNKVTKYYDGLPVLKGIDLEIHELKTLALIGPSGGGKSTLMRILAGLETPSSGQVVFSGKPLPRDENKLRQYRKKIGIVFQAFNLFPHLSALENILLPLVRVHNHSASEAEEIALTIFKKLRLESHAHKKPGQLSGGQNQRIAIARALTIRPECLLLDEPTSSLDPEISGEVLDTIRDLRNEGIKIVMITHQLRFARNVADRVAFLSDGIIVESSPSRQFFDRPESEDAKRFLENALRYD